MANKEIKNKEKKNSLKSMKSELKKVIWPTPKQLVNNTLAVVAIVAVVTIIVFVLDLAFESANKYGVDKIKEIIVDSNSNEVENVEENSENSENAEESSDTTEEVVENGTTETEATDAQSDVTTENETDAE